MPDAELAHIDETVGLHMLLRTGMTTTKVMGWGPASTRGAGLAHLYGQLYRVSLLPAYRTAYDCWLGRTDELL